MSDFIVCPKCERKSFNEGDIKWKFCASCGYHDGLDRSDGALEKITRRCRRGLNDVLGAKFDRHINEMKHLTTDAQLGTFTMIYALGGEVDEALHRAMKAMRIYIGTER